MTVAHLLDTNILLRLVDRGSRRHTVALVAVSRLLAAGNDLYITAQNLIEFWAVATRPIAVNGFGWEIARALSEVNALGDRFPLLDDTPEVFPHWLRLVAEVGVSGRQVHDARLVAVMQAHSIGRLLTFNVDDFRRYARIVAIHPDDVR